MPHTQSRYEQECGFPDGFLIVGPEDIMISGTATRVRNAAGDWSINVGNTQTVMFGLNLGQILQRSGLSDKFLEKYGGSNTSALGDPQGVYGSDTGLSTDAASGGNPVQVRTTATKKGVKITGFKISYQIGTVDLLAHTCRVDSVQYADGSAPTVGAVLASAANGLTVAVAAPNKTVTVNLAAPIYVTTDLKEYVLEIQAQTAGTGTYRLYRVELLCEFNFN